MNHLYIKETEPAQHILTAYNFKGVPLLYIQGRWGRVGDIVAVYDKHGALLYQAKQTLLSLFPHFDLTADGEHVGYIVKHARLFNHEQSYYTVSGFNWKIVSKKRANLFQIFHKGKKIGDIQKLTSHSGKAYTLNLADEYDLGLAALLTILLDHYNEIQNKDAIGFHSLSSRGSFYIQLPYTDFLTMSHQINKDKTIHS